METSESSGCRRGVALGTKPITDAGIGQDEAWAGGILFKFFFSAAPQTPADTEPGRDTPAPTLPEAASDA